MSDNARLSGTAAKQLASAGQRNGRKGLACPLSIISARSPMPCGHGQQRCHRAHRTGADRAVPVRHRAQSRFKSTCGSCARPGRPAYHRQAARARKPWIEACGLRDQRRTETHERSGDPGSRHDAGPQQPRRRTRNSSARKVRSRVSIPITPARPLTPCGATSVLPVWVGRYQTPCGMMLSGYLPIAAG